MTPLVFEHMYLVFRLPLFSVGSFGLTTAVNYALSGLIDWTIALLFIVGGVGRHSRHAFRDPPSIKSAHAHLHLCERHLRRRHLHAGAHWPSILAVKFDENGDRFLHQHSVPGLLPAT